MGGIITMKSMLFFRVGIRNRRWSSLRIVLLATIVVTLGNAPTTISVEATAGVSPTRMEWAADNSKRVNFQPEAFRLGPAKPGLTATAMSRADIDRDGIPDLITGYRDGDAALLAIHRGNEESIFPTNDPAPEPFFAANYIKVDTTPDHIVTGDLNNDTFQDILAGETGSDRLTFLKGDGKGGFSGESFHLPAGLTALASADVNRTDGLEDIIAAVDGESGPFLLVFEGIEGAFRDPAVEAVRLPEKAGKIVTGDLDGDGISEIAAAAGSQLIVVKGRDRQLARVDRQNSPTISITSVEADSEIHDIAVGRYSASGHQQFAVTTDHDAFLVSGIRGRLSKASLPNELRKKAVFAARVSSSGTTDEIVTADVSSGEIDIYSRGLRDDKWGRLAGSASNDEIVDVLPMRLNKDGLDDLVILTRNGGPVVSLSRPQTIFVVNSTANDPDAGPGNGVCLTAAGNCTLQAAIGEANASAGADEIRFSIGGGGAQSIPIDAQFLRDITDTVTIDGTTQPGFAGSPIIELNGARGHDKFAGASTDPLGLRVYECGKQRSSGPRDKPFCKFGDRYWRCHPGNDRRKDRRLFPGNRHRRNRRIAQWNVGLRGCQYRGLQPRGRRDGRGGEKCHLGQCECRHSDRSDV